MFVLRPFPRFMAEWGEGFLFSFFFFFFGQEEQIFVSFLLLREETRDRKWRRISVSLFCRKAPVWFGQTMPNRRDQGLTASVNPGRVYFNPAGAPENTPPP